jgi:hypothetical protein
MHLKADEFARMRDCHMSRGEYAALLVSRIDFEHEE